MTKLTGQVLHGRGYGKVLGFPTANIDRRQYGRLPNAERRRIRFGIYAGIVVLPSGRPYRAGIVIGPNDAKGLPHLEAYLLDFKGNLYGKKLVFELHRYLRPYKKIAGEQKLKLQIQKDVAMVKKIKLPVNK